MNMQQAFDSIAEAYDQDFSQTALGKLLRDRVWQITSRHLQRSKVPCKALELNCGTGVDALWLAHQGFQVLATDVSSEMIVITQSKIEQYQLEQTVSTRIASFADIAEIPESEFDLIFSNFGGLNCISPQELSQLGTVLSQKLNPGGQFVAVVMSRFCLWEMLYFIWKGKPKAAFRRFSSKPIEVQLNGQTSVKTWYYSPGMFQRHLGIPGAKTIQYPVGTWLAPSYLNPFLAKWPRLLRLLNYLESICAPSWLSFAGDHFWICIEAPKQRPL